LRLETERLIIRPMEPDDAEGLLDMLRDPSTWEFIGPPRVASLEDARGFVAQKAGYNEEHAFALWTVVEKTSGVVIGDCGLQVLEEGPDVELGYHLAAPYRRRGYTTEAARACLRYGFEELGLDRIVAVAWPDNTASQRVMEKCGMRRVGPGFHYGHETVDYEITREEFAAPAG
jgi:RimJ/RimL family protein N-acetyltransferase